jgi:hypothetical protein
MKPPDLVKSSFFGCLRLMHLLAWMVIPRSCAALVVPSIQHPISRRDSFEVASLIFVSQQCKAANAACLPGDLSPDCIGVYKVPIDEEIEPMVGTEEALAKYAPGLKYVPPIQSPSTAKDSIEILLAQRKAADDIRDVVLAGRLEEAGIKVLNLLPKVTSAGKVALEAKLDLTTASRSSDAIKDLRRKQLQSRFNEVTVAFNNVDITIGQGIRGQMGSPAVAQLTILGELKEAIQAFDDFLAVVQ